MVGKSLGDPSSIQLILLSLLLDPIIDTAEIHSHKDLSSEGLRIDKKIELY